MKRSSTFYAVGGAAAGLIVGGVGGLLGGYILALFSPSFGAMAAASPICAAILDWLIQTAGFAMIAVAPGPGPAMTPGAGSILGALAGIVFGPIIGLALGLAAWCLAGVVEIGMREAYTREPRRIERRA